MLQWCSGARGRWGTLHSEPPRVPPFRNASKVFRPSAAKPASPSLALIPTAVKSGMNH